MRDVTYCYNDINDFGALYLSRKIRQRKSMSGGNLYVSGMCTDFYAALRLVENVA